MIYGSVCSGIEAASVAWEPLGWQPAFFSEIEKFPSAILAHHWPDVPNFGDMTKFKEWPDVTIDLLVGGTPCQSFSVAGLRKGLRDPRGNLMLTYLAIAARYRPRWLVWENVPGVLSSDMGRDFGSFLGALGKLGYHAAWRVLDAQYVRTQRFPRAVPQRRRRVFVVGYLGDWRRAAAVLFDGESLSGNPPPRRQAGQKPAPTISARTTGGGGLGADFDLDGGRTAVSHALRGEGFDASEDGSARGTPIIPDWPAEVAPTLNAHFGGKKALENQHINEGGGCSLPMVANPLTARMHKGINTTLDEGQTLIANGGVFDAIAFDCKGTEVQTAEDGSHPTLRSMGHNKSHQNAGGHAAVSVGMAVRRLTPTECERLQGFPDGHTQIRWRAKPAEKCPDGPRYKALGNSMAVNVMEWIGERIETIEALAVNLTDQPGQRRHR